MDISLMPLLFPAYGCFLVTSLFMHYAPDPIGSRLVTHCVRPVPRSLLCPPPLLTGPATPCGAPLLSCPSRSPMSCRIASLLPTVPRYTAIESLEHTSRLHHSL